MVQIFKVALVAFGSLAVAQRGGNWDQWRDICNRPEYKDYCQQWIDWVGSGQQGRPPAGGSSPGKSGSASASRFTPKSTSSKSASGNGPPQWGPSSATAPAWGSRTTGWGNPPPSSTMIMPTQPSPAIEPQQQQPQQTQQSQSTTQQMQEPPAAVTAICTVEIYSFTTRPPGQRTRTRTRTIIMPVVSTITSLLTTDTTSIAVETILQEQREQTVTSSQTICNP